MAGTVIQSRIDAWPDSAIVRMSPFALAPASATDAAKGKISAAAADPTPQPVVQPIRLQQRNGAVLLPNSPKAEGLWAVPKPASPKALRCVKGRGRFLHPE